MVSEGKVKNSKIKISKLNDISNFLNATRSYEAQAKKGNFTYSLYFLLGKNSVMDEIYQEQEKYGDIIVGNFLDSYDKNNKKK